MKASIYLSLFLLFVFSNIAFSQDLKKETQNSEIVPAKNAVYPELGGNGLIYSINYERILTSGTSSSSYVRIGGAVHDQIKFGIIEIGGLIHRRKYSSIDIALGYTYSHGVWGEDDEIFAVQLLTLRVGYRYQKGDGIFKIAPMVIRFDKTVFGPAVLPYLGVSFGYAF